MSSLAPSLAPQFADDTRLIGGNLTGRYTLPDDSTGARAFACRAQSISYRSVALSAPVSGTVGGRANLWLADFGILRGIISRLHDFGFVVDLTATDEERAIIRGKIRWLKRRVAREVTEQRRHKRILPRNPESTLVLADGSIRPCFVIDMSASGAAVSADYTPDLGQPLAVGRAVGRVTRHLELGFAIAFTEVQQPDQLELILAKLDQQV